MRFLKKIANNSLQKHSITSKRNAVTYNQALEEVMWLLRLAKPKEVKKFQKNLKRKLQVAYQKILKFGMMKVENLRMAEKHFQ